MRSSDRTLTLIAGSVKIKDCSGRKLRPVLYACERDLRTEADRPERIRKR